MFSTGKYSRFNYLVFTILLSTLSLVTSPAYAETILHINTPDGTIATSVQTFTNTGSIPVSATVLENNAILFSTLNASPENWSAEFIAPLDESLTATNYEDAVRPDIAPENIKPPTKPGMNISIGSQFRQCQTNVFGRFDVLEINYKPDGSLKTLAIDFVQYCDSDIATKLKPLRGSIRHNSKLPIETLIPIAIAGADQHVVEKNIVDLTAKPITKTGNKINLYGNNSSAGKAATIVSYNWTQVDGPTINFSDSSSNSSSITNPSFVIPQDIKLGGEKIILELMVTNSNGVIDTDQVTLFVASKSDPQTSFFFESDPADYVGQGQNVYIDIDDANFSIDNTATSDHAHVTIDNGPFWFSYFGAIIGTGGLIVNPYTNAVRHPDATGTSPSISIHNLNRQCANVSGDFHVIQNTKNINNLIKNLRIDFTQICNYSANPATKVVGVVKYNYVDVSVPIANAGPSQTVKETSKVILDASNSDDPGGSIGVNGYNWSQTSGTTISLSSNTVSNPTFTAPTLNNIASEDLTFKVLVTDNEGFKAESAVTITIIPLNQPIKKSDPATDGGGGGCNLNPTAKIDLSLYLILFLILLIKMRRKFNFSRTIYQE